MHWNFYTTNFYRQPLNTGLHRLHAHCYQKKTSKNNGLQLARVNATCANYGKMQPVWTELNVIICRWRPYLFHGSRRILYTSMPIFNLLSPLNVLLKEKKRKTIIPIRGGGGTTIGRWYGDVPRACPFSGQSALPSLPIYPAISIYHQHDQCAAHVPPPLFKFWKTLHFQPCFWQKFQLSIRKIS